MVAPRGPPEAVKVTVFGEEIFSELTMLGRVGPGPSGQCPWKRKEGDTGRRQGEDGAELGEHGLQLGGPQAVLKPCRHLHFQLLPPDLQENTFPLL